MHVNNNSFRGRLIIEAFEKRAPDSGLQTFLKCKKKEKPLENLLFAKKKCRQLEKKLRKLFIYSPVFNLLWFDPTIIASTIVKIVRKENFFPRLPLSDRDSNRERFFTALNPESATKWVAALCLQRPFPRLGDTTHSKREKMKLSLPTPSKQRRFAVWATCKKQKTTQLWIEGGRKSLRCFVVWYVSHKTIVSYKFCRSLGPGSALGEKGKKIDVGKKEIGERSEPRGFLRRGKGRSPIFFLFESCF